MQSPPYFMNSHGARNKVFVLFASDLYIKSTLFQTFAL